MTPTPAAGFSGKARGHPHLYEINTLAWLEELSLQHGKTLTLAGVPDSEWEQLRDLGFDFVWLMGIWKRSPVGRRISRTETSYFPLYDEALPAWQMEDVVGSPYSVQDYTPDPRIGSWADIDCIRRKLHSWNMGLILDFVPNHTAPDHSWVQDHPEYYIQGTLQDFRKNPEAFFLSGGDGPVHFIARGKDPYFPAWPDTAQLNYHNPATRKAMMGVLERITGHCDGARCDMAMLVANQVFANNWQAFLSGWPAPQDEFWPAAVSAFPAFIWIAEVYWDMEAQMQSLGFDFCYDKRLYDRLLGSKPEDVQSHLRASLAYQSRLVRFLENHDERRSAAAFGRERIPAVATLAAFLPGMIFYHQGQLEGKVLHLPIQLRRASREPTDVQIRELYRKLMRISQEPAFHEGEWRLLEVSAAGGDSFQNIIAYQWCLGEKRKLVLANLAPALSQANIALDCGAGSCGVYKFYDQLNDRTYEWQGRDLVATGLFVRLDGYRSHVFDVTWSG